MDSMVTGNISMIRLFKLDERLEYDNELYRKVNVLLAMLVATILTLLATSLLSFSEGDLDSSIRDWVFIALLLLHLGYFYRSLNYELTAVGMLVFAGIFLFINQIYGTVRYEFMFLYAYPVAAAFVAGFRKGLLLSFILFLASVSLMLFQFVTIRDAYFQEDIIIRFILTYFLVMLFAFILESLRDANQRELYATNEQLKALSLKDGLTGLYNRRFYDFTIEREIRSFRRRKKEFSLLQVQLDYFDSHFDEYGPQSVDRVLVRVSEVLKKSACRATDVICKTGLNEFIMVLPETSLTGAETVAATVQKNINYLGVENKPYGRLTASIGIVQFGVYNIDSLSGLVRATEFALSEAKKQGTNQTFCYQGD